MGAWGTKSFEHDSTCDWYDEFCDSDQSVDQLEDAFDNVIENEDYLDYEFCTAALAAAEIIAAAFGNPSEDFPDEEHHAGDDEESTLPEPDLKSIRKEVTTEIIEKAQRAVKKVRQYRRSELRELWEDSEEYDDWLETTQDLIDRLKNT
jgi:hypothetical protein